MQEKLEELVKIKHTLSTQYNQQVNQLKQIEVSIVQVDAQIQLLQALMEEGDK